MTLGEDTSPTPPPRPPRHPGHRRHPRSLDVLRVLAWLQILQDLPGYHGQASPRGRFSLVMLRRPTGFATIAAWQLRSCSTLPASSAHTSSPSSSSPASSSPSSKPSIHKLGKAYHAIIAQYRLEAHGLGGNFVEPSPNYAPRITTSLNLWCRRSGRSRSRSYPGGRRYTRGGS